MVTGHCLLLAPMRERQLESGNTSTRTCHPCFTHCVANLVVRLSTMPQGSHTNEQDANSQTPLLKRPLPKPATLLARITLLFQNWWLWEIISAITAVLAFTVIIVILAIFDQSSLPDWPSVFTVRSVYILCVKHIAECLRR